MSPFDVVVWALALTVGLVLIVAAVIVIIVVLVAAEEYRRHGE